MFPVPRMATFKGCLDKTLAASEEIGLCLREASGVKPNPLAQDLDEILNHCADFWPKLEGQGLFLTGGTGFYGCWLLESLVHARQKLDLDLRVTVLTRSAEAFHRKAPHLAGAAGVTLVEGDICSFSFPQGRFPFVIHGATEASVALNRDEPALMLNTITEGTRRCLEFARQAGTRRFLLTSSGAVYGTQPREISHLSEDYNGAPNPLDPLAAYGEGKRVAELLCALYARQYQFEAVSARGFAFLGAYLPLDRGFAAGNFLQDALAGDTLHIQGDGTPLRSYLYAADLVVWLWRLLERGASGQAYNVGSSQAVSVLELAQLIAQRAGGREVKVAVQPQAGVLPLRYVPDVGKAERELSLRAWTSLETAVDRSLRWFGHGDSG